MNNNKFATENNKQQSQREKQEFFRIKKIIEESFLEVQENLNGQKTNYFGDSRFVGNSTKYFL